MRCPPLKIAFFQYFFLKYLIIPMYYHLFPIVVIDVLARLQILYETFNPDIMTDFQFDYGSMIRTGLNVRYNKKTCPEETLYQLGTLDKHASAEILVEIFEELKKEFEERFGSHVHIIDWALHMDEATSHSAGMKIYSDASVSDFFKGIRSRLERKCQKRVRIYECGGYIYSGEGQELGQFWAKLNVGNAKLQKTSSNTSITDGNGNYSIAGATYGVFSDKDCTKQLATLTTDENGNTDIVEVKAGTVYIKELSAPAGYKVDKTVYPLTIKAGETATLKVSDTPKVTDTLIELFKIDMETQKDNPQGNASLAGAEFTWKYYAVVTDDNGQFSTSADWASHKHNTNAGKTSEDGVWFGTSEPDDSKGALPYDTYIIEELRSDSNKGFELIPPFEIVVSRNNLVIDLGTLTDEYEKEISIHTTATSKDGEKTILAGKEVTIVDTVKLDGLR